MSSAAGSLGSRITTIRSGEAKSYELLPLTASDSKFLTAFQAEVARLREISTKIPPTSLSMSLSFGDAGNTAETTWNNMPPELYSALVLRLRRFILEREPYYFFKISKLLSTYMDEPDLRAILRAVRGYFKGDHVLKGIDVQADPAANSDKVLLDYLNAKEYHRDESKMARLNDGGIYMYAIREYSAYEAMMHKLSAINTQAAIIRSMLDGTEFRFDFSGED